MSKYQLLSDKTVLQKSCHLLFPLCCLCLVQDPILRNLESRFALQQKIVEAAKKLANEPELCKTVKKKRRRNCLDAMHKLQQIENEMNQYRIKKGKKPTQRASVIIAGTEQVNQKYHSAK